MDRLSKSELLLADKNDPRSEGWLANNVLNPFVNGSGAKQIYNNFAEKKLEPSYVAQAQIMSTNWIAQTLSSGTAAVITYALAGKALGIGICAASKNIGLESSALRFLQKESTAQILGAGAFDFAKSPNQGETRLANAAASMTAFSIFSAGNHYIQASRLFSGAIPTALGKIGVGAAGGITGLETAHRLSAAMLPNGESRDLTFRDRIDAIAHGGFINIAMPALQRGLSRMRAQQENRTRSESDSSDIAEQAGLKGKSVSIFQWTEAYENWMSKQIKLLPEDLAVKHAEMAKDQFRFLRGTYYRWADTFPKLLPELQNAPKVNSVGDLHVDNFGTWTNRKGRPVWGINDFDESARLPYTNDLVRLVTSAKMLKSEGELKLGTKEAAEAVLEGYKQALRDGGKPFLLDEHPELYRIAKSQTPESDKFWQKLKGQLKALSENELPQDALTALRSNLPDQTIPLIFGHRQAGVGSLGRQRFLALGQFEGGNIASEAKAVLPPATVFVEGKSSGRSNYNEILSKSVREPDPSLRVGDNWVVRELSPSRNKIELGEIKPKDERLLLYSMGYETANIHLGTRNAGEVLADLARRDKNWLADAAKTMNKSVSEDQSRWKEQPAP